MEKVRQELQFRYLRTTQVLEIENELTFSDTHKIRLFNSIESAKFVETMRKSNIVARFGGQSNFYLNQANELSNQTVIEIYEASFPDEILKIGENLALFMEKLAILSTTFTMHRKELLGKLGIGSSISSEINFAVTSKFKTIRSSSQRTPSISKIKINEAFINRFHKLEFNKLFNHIKNKDDLSKRLINSINWLVESRREPIQNTSVVKTAIALESLLIFSESESLARSLSERSAFILSNSVEIRKKISSIILKFYDVRSGIVHGSQKKAKRLTIELIECVDRLTLLIHLTIARNRDLWEDVESLRLWCEEQKWGSPFSTLNFSISSKYLNNALALVSDK